MGRDEIKKRARARVARTGESYTRCLTIERTAWAKQHPRGDAKAEPGVSDVARFRRYQRLEDEPPRPPANGTPHENRVWAAQRRRWLQRNSTEELETKRAEVDRIWDDQAAITFALPALPTVAQRWDEIDDIVRVLQSMIGSGVARLIQSGSHHWHQPESCCRSTIEPQCIEFAGRPASRLMNVTALRWVPVDRLGQSFLWLDVEELDPLQFNEQTGLDSNLVAQTTDGRYIAANDGQNEDGVVRRQIGDAPWALLPYSHDAIDGFHERTPEALALGLNMLLPFPAVVTTPEHQS